MSLSVDFSDVSPWCYVMGVDINGTIDSTNSIKNFSSSLRTYLKGKISAHDKNTVVFYAEQPRLTSNFLSEQEKLNLEHEFENAQLCFAPKEGALYVPDNKTLPSITIGDWDLFRNFAKVIPILPEKAVSPGEKWERERQFPLETNYGDATGHLFQLFTFDSLFTRDSSILLAAISWTFSYKIELLTNDSPKITAGIPLSGNGDGWAVIDLQKKKIRTAHATFESDPAANSPSNMKWSETVHMEIIE